jgi:hypothetical protein
VLRRAKPSNSWPAETWNVYYVFRPPAPLTNRSKLRALRSAERDRSSFIDVSTTLRSTSWPTYVAAGSAVFAIALGVVVLAGWVFHLPTLVQIRPDLLPMTRNAAAAFALCGAGLLSIVAGGRDRCSSSASDRSAR